MNDPAFQQALRDARLPLVIPRLDEEANWSLELSGGEQHALTGGIIRASGGVAPGAVPPCGA